MSKDSSPDFLKYTLNGINAAYEVEVREAREAIKRAEERRDALIAKAREWAQGRGGTAVDSPIQPKEDGATLSGESMPQQNGAATNGSSVRVVPKEVVRGFVDEVMADPSVEIVTQTEVKDRILANYPVSDSYLNSLRVLIITSLNELMERGYLELVEKARAGKPHKYRKTGKTTEANLLET